MVRRGLLTAGVVAFVLDEAMGSAAWLAGYPCLAANLNIDFMEMTPLGRDCFIEAKLDEVRPTKLAVSVVLSLDGKLLVRGRGVFPRINKKRMVEMSRILGQPLPDLSGYEFART